MLLWKPEKAARQFRDPYVLVILLIVFLLGGCGVHSGRQPPEEMLAYTPRGEDRLAKYSPIVVVEYPEYEYNRIGSPEVDSSGNGGNGSDRRVAINPDVPVFFTEERSWQGKLGTYTNLIYRLHFSEVPFSLIPFHLTAGRNVGLLVIITINAKNQPVLVTTLHTCGCYLAFIPTSFLAPEAFPADWNMEDQWVFGEKLPGHLYYTGQPELQKIFIYVRDGVHRVMDLQLNDPAMKKGQYRTAVPALQPLVALSRLQATEGTSVSFFETEGERNGYVRDSQKIWERLMISWWALDWRVGEDKRFGRNTTDGPIFYTSLKPWARRASDLRDFAMFLEYWGWHL